MCLGMANGYRVPEKENINESPKTNVKTIIEKTEEQLKKAETDGEKIYLSAFLDGAKAQKEENHILMNALYINSKNSDDKLELSVCTRIREFIRELKAIANSEKIISIDGKWAISQSFVDKLLIEWGVGVEDV